MKMGKIFLDRVPVDPGIIHVTYDPQPQVPFPRPPEMRIKELCYNNCSSCHVEDIFSGDCVHYDAYMLWDIRHFQKHVWECPG